MSYNILKKVIYYIKYKSYTHIIMKNDAINNKQSFKIEYIIYGMSKLRKYVIFVLSLFFFFLIFFSTILLLLLMNKFFIIE